MGTSKFFGHQSGRLSDVGADASVDVYSNLIGHFLNHAQNKVRVSVGGLT